MLSRSQIIESIISDLTQSGANRIAIFGSFARGDERPDSDIDILVEFSPPKSLLELVRIERELSEHLGRKIDLLTEKSISPAFYTRIQQDLEVVYS